MIHRWMHGQLKLIASVQNHEQNQELMTELSCTSYKGKLASYKSMHHWLYTIQ